MTLRLPIFGFLLLGAQALASPVLPYLKAGCPVLIVDREHNLALTPWSCAPETGDYVCENAVEPCDRVGRVDGIIKSSYARDLNMHLILVRPFFRRMEAFSEFRVKEKSLSFTSEQTTEEQKEEITSIIGLTTSSQFKRCTLLNERGVILHSLDDIRTTKVLRDQLLEGDYARSAIETRCSGIMTNYLYLPRQGFRCEGGEADVYALLQDQTIIGTVAMTRQEEPCRNGFPDFLTSAGQFHVRDGLNHDYFDFRVRSFSGHTAGMIPWPPIAMPIKYSYYTPLTMQLLLTPERFPRFINPMGYSTSIVYALRQSTADAKSQDLDLESLRSTSAYLSQVYKAQLQRQEYHKLTAIHIACNEFHRLILEYISEPMLAAELLPACGHQLSALQAIILQIDHDPELSPANWIGQILSRPTASAVIEALQSKQPEYFLRALEVSTAEELNQFRTEVDQSNSVH